MIIRKHACARAGLIGNPSDGYFGKAISILLRNFRAEVVLYESPDLVIEPSGQDISRFRSLAALMSDVRRHGYYGGVRLIKATIHRFGTYCAEQGTELGQKNFTIAYTSDIPRLVGMAGSSAIITATLHALMTYYAVDIPKPVQANLILSVENKELGIGAGLQDRVIQVYGGAVYMDFDQAIMARQGYGHYEEIDPGLLPGLYVAYDPDRAEGSERFHNHVRALFDEGESRVVDAMHQFAAFAAEARDLLVAGQGARIGPLLNRNFDLRTSIYEISKENMAMIEAARSEGASAKFAGSGGAIIGTFEDKAMFERLRASLERIGCHVLEPEIA